MLSISILLVYFMLKGLESLSKVAWVISGFNLGLVSDLDQGILSLKHFHMRLRHQIFIPCTVQSDL